MREIKFRGKRVDNGEWVSGSLLVLWRTDVKPSESNDDIHDFEDVKAYFIVMEVHTDYEFDDEYRHEVHPETVGQYTGLKDAEEIEMYEGNKIAFAVFDYNGADTQYEGYIKFANGQWEIWKSWDDEYYGHDGAFSLYWVCSQYDEVTVIGNI